MSLRLKEQEQNCRLGQLLNASTLPLSALCSLAIALSPASIIAQQGKPQPVASVSTQGVILQGALSVVNGRATVGGNSEIAAEYKTAQVSLARGGNLAVCASTALRITRDVLPQADSEAGNAGLMFSLDRGAFEAHYTTGKYADVVMTPDLRILISGPGIADLKLRVNETGDTCVDNAGQNAPYVVASSLRNGGIYRIEPGQRVLFVGGSLTRVVDNEHEPCGCPPAPAPGGNDFPLAVSEGLQPPPKLGGTPIVPEGTPHAQVTATFSSATPPGPPPGSLPGSLPRSEAGAATTPVVQPTAPKGHRGFFGSIGHFFARVFGAD